MSKRMGWLPDYPDYRDFTIEHEKIEPLLEKLMPGIVAVPSSVDLRNNFSPIEDQGNLGSCTANAGIGLLEYFERKAHGRFIDASRLFLYKTTRNLLKLTGDTGAFLRSTMGALVLFGVPPEDYWPYNIDAFDIEPPAFCYAFAQNFQTLRYYRLDSMSITETELLDRIKTYVSRGLPPMFGFTVYSSIWQADNDGKIPFPSTSEHVEGGHAVDVVGYDDSVVITNNLSGQQSIGALLIRNSWGTSWGEKGYGWLPYAYVLRGLTEDWWSLLKAEWINTGQFSNNK